MQMIQWLLLLGVILTNVWIILHRLKKLRHLQWDFKDLYSEYTTKALKLKNRYVAEYSDRDDITQMSKCEGETKELWDETTLNIDDIWIHIKAVEEHLGKAQDKAAAGNFFRFGPLREAVDMLLERHMIQYDTGQIQGELFNSRHNVIQFQLCTFNQIRSHYHEDWEKLKIAAQAQVTPAMERFPRTTLDELITLCEKHRLPETWLQDHPLIGDEADTRAWSEADALRLADPMGYLKHIANLLATEQKIVGRITNLESSLTGLEQSRVHSFPLLNTKVSPDKDPSVTLAEAHQEDDKLTRLLIKAAPDLKQVTEQLSKVLNLYAKAKGQYATLEVALEKAKKDTELALSKGSPDSETGLVLADAQKCLNAALDTHHISVLTSVKEALATAKKCLGNGLMLALEAQVSLSRKRHLEARQQVGVTLNLFGLAEQHARFVLTQINWLDQERESFEHRLTEMDNLRSQYVSKVKEYCGDTEAFPVYQTPQTSDNQDYMALNAFLDTQIHVWQQIARDAQELFHK